MVTKQRFASTPSVQPSNATYNAAVDRIQNVIGTRLAEARKSQGLSLVALSQRLAQRGLMIQRTGLYRWESGDAIPNAYQLLAVCHELGIEDVLGYFSTLPGAQPELNDEGLKKLAEYKSDLIATGRYRPQKRPAKAKILYIEKPVSSLSASAGSGEFLEEGSFEMVRFPAASVPEHADFGIRVSGDSMEPVYRDGQIVWVQECGRLNPGEVGIFMYDGDGYIKVYEEQEPEDCMRDSFIDSSGVLHMQPVLISYNEKYEPKLVSPELSFSIVGRVLN